MGIAGLISMLRTMADRRDVRPVVLFYGNREWDDVAFRDELEELEDRLDLTVVHVLEQPPPRWTGESGYLTADVLRRHLPHGYRRFQYFICGPDPMMDATEAALASSACRPSGCTPSASRWPDAGSGDAARPHDAARLAGRRPDRRGLRRVRRRAELNAETASPCSSSASASWATATPAHLDLPPRHRQHRDHRYCPRPPRADDPGAHPSGCKSARRTTPRTGSATGEPGLMKLRPTEL